MAKVWIDFTDPDSSTKGIYEAKIEVCGEVITALNSAKAIELEAVKQYHVSHLAKAK